MARPQATKPTDKQKTFVVNEGFSIFDMEGVRKNAGERLELTQAQAKHFQKLNAITVDMGELFDEESNDDDTTDGSSKGGSEPQVKRSRKPSL